MYFFILASFFSTTLFAVAPHAYVANQLGHAINVIDVKNDSVQTIFGFNHPRVIKIPRTGKVAYVGSDDNTIRVIDTVTHTLLPVVIDVNCPLALALSPNGQFIYVLSRDNTVSIIRTRDYKLVKVLKGFRNPQDLKVSPDGTFAYVTNADDGTISVINTATYKITQTIAGFKTPVGITFTVDGAVAYVTDTRHNTVYAVDTTTHTISNLILGFNQPSYIAVSPDKSFAYVTNKGNHTVSILRTSDNFVLFNSILIPEPKSIAITPDGQYLYVSSGIGLVFKILLKDLSIAWAIPGFSNPSNIAITYNNPPGNSVNGYQVILSPKLFYNYVTWNDGPGNPIGYKIYRDASFSHLIADLGMGETEYKDKNLVKGQTYSYFVVAEYEDGFSSSIGNVQIDPAH